MHCSHTCMFLHCLNDCAYRVDDRHAQHRRIMHRRLPDIIENPKEEEVLADSKFRGQASNVCAEPTSYDPHR